MFEWTDEQIGAWVGMHLWPLFRISSFMMTTPILGTQIVPARVRLTLALLMTILIVPSLPPVPEVDPLSVNSVAIIIQQVLIGLAMGFAVLLLFQLFVVTGQIVAMNMGLGFASMVDPTNGITVTALSQFYLMLVTLLFLSMGGHLVMFEAVVESFRFLPVSAQEVDAWSWWYLASRISWMFASALMIALPAVTALLIVNISFGVMTRAAPQMNIFSIGFPMTVLFGLVVFWISIGGILPQFTVLSENTFDFMQVMLQPTPP
ncbi:flagellar biosynthetic protein FliR [Hahella aquimaris]|uniref:flagellar biosynthetic protein FliR n=1 Tax=Hahella sp. HNIBRBA332 TaxID=3015983 RepID=UPI00273BA3EB|nr:flagellar biosynthetic protein FliR [Hahella sp. HNIBRBA332]WLQ14714.1 flagellar biosynthetic protein FliR [Hahella sp. HNIBRBA332]